MKPAKQYEGTILNGWKILEELPVEEHPEWCSQQRHNNRRFRCLHLETGMEIERTLISIRNCKGLTMPWERKRFKDFRNKQVGIYNVLSLTPDSCLPPKHKVKKGFYWNVLNTRTGEELVMSSKELIYLERQIANPRKVRTSADYLYRFFVTMHLRCNNEKHKLYKHYGALGMSVSPEWDDFTAFRDDVIREIGDRPSKDYTMFIKRGKVFGPGNVEWVPVHRGKLSITHKSLLGSRLLIA